MSDLRQFSQRFSGYGVILTIGVNNLARRAALAVLTNVVKATPVDTGEARSNWKASLGEADEEHIEPHFPGSHLGLSETANAEKAIEDGLKIIDKRQPGQDIYVQNNTPYIGVLNDGSSAQAPAAFVEQGVLAGVAALKGGQVLVSETRTV